MQMWSIDTTLPQQEHVSLSEWFLCDKFLASPRFVRYRPCQFLVVHTLQKSSHIFGSVVSILNYTYLPILLHWLIVVKSSLYLYLSKSYSGLFSASKVSSYMLSFWALSLNRNSCFTILSTLTFDYSCNERLSFLSLLSWCPLLWTPFQFINVICSWCCIMHRIW